jgi:sensor histidine kinase YesM
VRRLLRILVINILTAGVVTLLGSVQGGWSPPTTYFLITLIYTNVIGTAAHLVLPRVAERLDGRLPRLQWAVLAGVLFGLGVVGSLVSGVIAVALGFFGAPTTWAALRTGLVISLVFTMSVGMGITLYKVTRARLDDAHERLRAHELETERARRLATDARLASLESRLHPHFLFNAIAAIAGQVRDSPEHAERLLIEFADLLRASLDSSHRHTVPLSDELAIVSAYLGIEQARLGDRLRCTLDVAEGLHAWPVPPFALHTLAQNSVKHVAAARVQGAQIRIDARRAGDRLALSVWDDGPGVDLEAAPPGHGLDTLRARLTALFGGDAGLGASRGDGGGRVTIVLPARPAIAERP